jgi:EAL domain-containing protein (putative c-di-GMP-specific phosphodiesterase class I)
MTVAVNLSPKQFVGGKLIGIVEAALAANELEGSRLELEVTESLLLADSEAVIKELVGLKALGVTLAMDDFGTGYSSLAYLWRYPFDRIKLDRSFMGAFESDPAKVEAMLSSVVALGRNMALKITAEGIETIEQAVFVARLGADRVQGFLFGRPMPSESIAATLLERNSAGASDAGARRSLRVVA